MSISKRPGSPFYQFDFTVKGDRFRGSTEAKDAATARSIETKLRNDALLGAHFKRKPRMTFNVAFERYWQERGQFCGSAMSAIDLHTRHILGHFGESLYLDELDDSRTSKWIAEQVNSESSRKKPLSNATINRRLEFMGTVLKRARTLWGIETPELNITKHKLLEPEARTRWLTPEEAEKLIDHAAMHLKAPIRFALLTGARLSNITGLQWEDVNLVRRIITFRGVKSRKPGGKTLEVPISGPCFDLLITQKPKKSGHVFVRHFSKPSRKTGEQRQPEPIAKFRRSFATACKNAGITDFRFHDLRHTAASYMIQAGAPIDVVREILGHSDISMTLKYAHRDARAKTDVMEKLGFASQIRHIEPERKKA